MTKIFITIPWFLPAFRAGGPIQSIANLVREFNADVRYFIFCSDTDMNGAALDNVKTGEWVQYNTQTQVWYADHEKISDSLVKQVETIKPDVLYIIGIYSWHFNIVPLLYCKAPKKILSTRGMLHPGALSQKKWKKKIYLGIFKLMEYHHKVYFHATGEEEKKYICNFFGKAAKVFVAGAIPNKIQPIPIAEKERGNLNLVSIGLISPMENILLVLQALQKATANIEYDIYGPVQDYDYHELCKQQIKSLPGNVRVKYHKEPASQELQKILCKAHIFIVQYKNQLFGHTIYEALSAGRPVITSNQISWKRLEESKAGFNVPTNDTTGLINAINFFAAMSKEELGTWCEGAQHYSEDAVDILQTKKAYAAMFDL